MYIHGPDNFHSLPREAPTSREWKYTGFPLYNLTPKVQHILSIIKINHLQTSILIDCNDTFIHYAPVWRYTFLNIYKI